jgi:hypothetical protein
MLRMLDLCVALAVSDAKRNHWLHDESETSGSG